MRRIKSMARLQQPLITGWNGVIVCMIRSVVLLICHLYVWMCHAAPPVSFFPCPCLTSEHGLAIFENKYWNSENLLTIWGRVLGWVSFNITPSNIPKQYFLLKEITKTDGSSPHTSSMLIYMLNWSFFLRVSFFTSQLLFFDLFHA